MTKEQLKKLKVGMENLLPASEVDKARQELIKAVKEKDKEILVNAVIKRIGPLFKELGIDQPIIEIKIPELNIGDVAPKIEVITLNASEIPRPIVNIPPANITVTSAPVKIPKPNITVKPPEVKVKVAAPDIKIPPFPTEMTVKGFEKYSKAMTEYYRKTTIVTLEGVNHKSPLPVIMLDGDGQPFRMTAPQARPSSGGGGGGLSVISFKDKEPKGYQKLTVDGTLGGVGLTVPTGSNYAVLVCESNNIRWRDDDTGPTATDGMPLYRNQSLALDGALLLNQFKAIRIGSSATLHISYYKK